MFVKESLAAFFSALLNMRLYVILGNQKVGSYWFSHFLCLQVENDLQELRGDLQSWLITQADEGTDLPMRDNPFAYTVGATQMRFGDDFDHERMARYDVSFTQ